MDEATRYLCFSSSGRSGVAYEGVLLAWEALDASGYARTMDQLRGVAGTSGGCLMALAVALRISPASRQAFVREFATLFAAPTANPNLPLLFRAQGMDDGAAFRRKVGDLLAAGGLSPTATLSDLSRLLRMRVVFTAHDLATTRTVHLCADTHPSMLVQDAVMASCCVPLIFTPVRHERLVLVDGCLSEECTSPFPEGETTMVVVRTCLSCLHEGVDTWPSFLCAVLAACTRTGLERMANLAAGPMCVIIDDPALPHVNDLTVPLDDSLFATALCVGWAACLLAARRDVVGRIGASAVSLATTLTGRRLAPDDESDGLSP